MPVSPLCPGPLPPCGHDGARLPPHRAKRLYVYINSDLSICLFIYLLYVCPLFSGSFPPCRHDGARLPPDRRDHALRRGIRRGQGALQQDDTAIQTLVRAALKARPVSHTHKVNP